MILNHLTDKFNRYDVDNSSASKVKSLNLIIMPLNILRNDLNHNTTAITTDNNDDNSIVTTISIDTLVTLVKSSSIKALISISNMLLIELSYRGSGNDNCK